MNEPTTNRELKGKGKMADSYVLINKAIRLEKVNAENFIDLMDLKVAESQKNYVASNTASMAQAYPVLNR